MVRRDALEQRRQYRRVIATSSAKVERLSGTPSLAWRSACRLTWNGAGAWRIFSQSRQVTFSRTCCTTFH